MSANWYGDVPISELTKEELEGNLIKPSKYKHDYSDWQTLELFRCKMDPIYFIEKYVRIEHPVLGAMPFRLFEYQKHLIRAYHQNTRVVAMLARQSGKTATASAFLLWCCLFRNNYKILVTSKDQSGADEIMTRLYFAYMFVPYFLKPGITKNDVRRKSFDNGSDIKAIATTKNSGRGLSISLLYVDELAFVRPSIAEPFWTSVQPTLSTGGSVIVTSTPNNAEDVFGRIFLSATPLPYSTEWTDFGGEKKEEGPKYETIFENDLAREAYMAYSTTAATTDQENKSDDGFKRFFSHWSETPHKIRKDGSIESYRGEDFKRQQIMGGMTEIRWQAEFECRFITSDATLVNSMKLAHLRNSIRPPKFVDRWGCRWYENIKPNTSYGVVMDPSGDGVGDDCAIQVWELPTLRQVAEWNSAEADQNEQTRMLRRVLRRINEMQTRHEHHVPGESEVYYSIERNGVGIGIIRAVEYEGEETFPGMLIDSTQRTMTPKGEKMMAVYGNRWRGLVTTAATKKRFAIELKSLIERGVFTPRSQFLISQLSHFTRAGSSYRAQEGYKDDLVMSCVLMVQLLEEIRMMDIDLDDAIMPEAMEPEEDTLEEDEIFIPRFG